MSKATKKKKTGSKNAKNTKSIKPADKVQTSKNTDTLKIVQKSVTDLLKLLKLKLLGLITFIINLPKRIFKWIVSRPSAIKTWIKNDRKKKKYRSFHLQKKIKPEPRDIPSVRKLFKLSGLFMWQHKKKLLPIMIINAAAYYLLIKTPTSILSISEIRQSVQNALGEGSLKTWNGTLATLGTVVGLNSTSGSNATQQSVSFLGISMVYIWVIRQLHNKHDFNIRDAFYQAFAPIIPILVLMVVATFQIIPFAVAGLVYSIARTGGVFVSGFEDMAFFSVAFLMSLLSFYWLTPTIIAIYVTTIPGMYPFRALKSARQLIQFQRFTVFRRIIIMPLAVLAIYFGTLLFTIRFTPGATLYVSEILAFIILPFIHIYLYKLYRSLL